MNFNLEKEFVALTGKHFSFFSQMCEQRFCILRDFNFCTNRVNILFNSFSPTMTVAVYGAGAHTRDMYSKLDPINKDKIAYFACTGADQKDLTFNGKKVLSPHELKSKNVDFVILSSWDYKQEMRKVLLEAGFAKEKLLEVDLDSIKLDEQPCFSLKCLNNVLFKHRKDNDISEVFTYYESSKYFINENEKIEALYSLIISFIAARDIVNIRRFSGEYIKKRYPMYQSLEAFVQDVDALIDRTYKRIQERKENAVVIYLFDAFEYVFLEHMPNLEKLYNKSLVFNKAFTQYSFTTSSLQVMFTGKDLIDEKAYEIEHFTVENSPVLQAITDDGYQLEVIRGDSRLSLFAHSDDINTHRTMLIASHQFFEMLGILSSCDKKQVLFLHFNETHTPFLSPFGNQFDINNLSKSNNNRIKTMMLARSLTYLDEQFAFVDAFLPTKASRIVMSDHGMPLGLMPQNMLTSEHYKYVNDLYHYLKISLFVFSPDLNPGVVDEIFCIKNFDMFLRFLFGQISIESLASSHVKIQKLPVYTKWALDFSLSLSMPERGIISQNGVYSYNYNGYEIYFPNECSNYIDDPTYSEEIEKMRELCGKDFYDLFDQPKFALAKKVYLEKGLIKEECTV